MIFDGYDPPVGELRRSSVTGLPVRKRRLQLGDIVLADRAGNVPVGLAEREQVRSVRPGFTASGDRSYISR